MEYLVVSVESNQWILRSHLYIGSWALLGLQGHQRKRPKISCLFSVITVSAWFCWEWGKQCYSKQYNSKNYSKQLCGVCFWRIVEVTGRVFRGQAQQVQFSELSQWCNDKNLKVFFKFLWGVLFETTDSSLNPNLENLTNIRHHKKFRTNVYFGIVKCMVKFAILWYAILEWRKKSKNHFPRGYYAKSLWYDNAKP